MRSRNQVAVRRSRSQDLHKERWKKDGSFGVVTISPVCDANGKLKDWRKQKVWVTRKRGWDRMQNAPKAYEIMKGHHERSDRTFTDAAIRESKQEGGWVTTRKLSQPGDHLLVQLYNERSGRVLKGLRNLEEIASLVQGTTNKDPSAMIVVIDDYRRDSFLPQPEDPLFESGPVSYTHLTLPTKA